MNKDWKPTPHTDAKGAWRVAVLSKNGLTNYVTDPNKYSSEASATLAAIASHKAKPFLDYVAVSS